MTDSFMTYAKHLGFKVNRVSSGEASLSAVVKPEHLNMHGYCHGGFTYSLADEAFALASNSHEADAVGLSAHIDYFVAVKEGDTLEAVATEENLSRRVATYRVEVKRQEQTIALFTGTVYRMTTKNPKAKE